ncbi:MAG TPA: beta-N-acetylhexosaminidase [Alphaproteobacteria bacterium]|nr:beta-N-acetylhexosaminidase [Alphaproteobacteria bacterium]
MNGSPVPRAAILGCAGLTLGGDERALFRDADPLGFILFARNCAEPAQVKDLVASLRAAVGRADAPILIDQEGGRVARLKPPHWRAAPAAARLGAIAARDPERAARASFLNARLIARELADLGIDVDCAPVLDLGLRETHQVIGDRAFAAEPEIVARLGRAFCDGLLAGAVMPVIKHIPGHGRARADSHLELPTVETDRATLVATDFAPFIALNKAPWAMTAHVRYGALDAENAATLSRRILGDIVRGAIGFEGVLVSDDLGMKALEGNFGARAAAALAAGCDLVLHCSGDRAEMASVIAATPRLRPESAARLARAAAIRRAAVQNAAPFDPESARAELDALLGPS